MMTWKWAWPLLLGLHALDAGAGWLDEAGVELRHDDNLTRAQLAQDIRGDAALAVSAATGAGYGLTDNSRLSLNLALSGSAYRHYKGLDNLTAGLELAYRWKFGLGPYVPELHFSGSATRLEYRDAQRDGWLYLGEIGIAKRLSDRSNLRMAYQVEQRKSDTVSALLPGLPPEMGANTFDLRSRNLIFGADYSLNSGYVLSAGYAIRDGDIESTTMINVPIFLASSAISADPVFGPNMYAYTMKAVTRGLSLGVSRIIGGQSSVSLGVEHWKSRAEGGIDYQSNLIRATYLYQF